MILLGELGRVTVGLEQDDTERDVYNRVRWTRLYKFLDDSTSDLVIVSFLDHRL